MALALTDTQNYSDIADAIRAKAGTQETFTPAQMAQAIADIPSGGGGESYPVRNDGKTHLWVVTKAAAEVVYVRFQQSASGGVGVDWGDGSAVETFDGTALAARSHAYAAPGTYEVTLEVVSGTLTLSKVMADDDGDIPLPYDNRKRLVACEIAGGVKLGANPFGYCFSLTEATLHDGVAATSGAKYVIQSSSFSNCLSLKRLHIGNGVSVSRSAFSYDYSLQSCVVAGDDGAIDLYGFNALYGLESLTFTGSRASASTFQMCKGCYKLTSVTLPSGVTRLDQTFEGCYLLPELTVPASVQSMYGVGYEYSSPVRGCLSLRTLNMLPATPPSAPKTVASGNAFLDDLPGDFVIHVPSGSLEAYGSAEYWSLYASHMVGDL